MKIRMNRNEIITSDLQKRAIMISGRPFLLDEIEFDGRDVLLSGEFVERGEIPAFLEEA